MKPLQLTKSMQSAKLNWRQILFAGLLTGSLFCSPVVTLFAGILFALTLGNPFPVWSKKASKKLLQYCVVGLGFGMNFHESLAAGREGMTFTVVSVVTVMIVGVVLGRLLQPADPAHARHFGRRPLRTFGHAVPDRRRTLHRGNPQGRPQASGAGHHPLGRHFGRIARRDLALVGSIRLP